MQNAIRQKIKKLASRAIERADRKRKKEEEYAHKYLKRTGRSPALSSKPPKSPLHKHFDPVYCKRNANFLAKTIWYKILSRTYQPAPAVKFEIPKAGGGKRKVTQFTIPDAAVAAVLHSRLTIRNLKKQSGNSFAYRPDRNVFDALLKLRSSIKPQRNYVLQLDFEKYFDTIPHNYLNKLLKSPDSILLSEIERSVISAFLCHRYSHRGAYLTGPYEASAIGTPQGSSISLTLANLASRNLDESLEAINGQFARYADDTVVVCYSYEDACKAYDAFNSHCSESGLQINRSKSPGIRILSVDEKPEFESIRDLKFLGYGLCLDGLVMHEAVEQRLKKNLSRLINLYLLHYIEKVPPISKRVGPGFDWDLVGLIMELRNVLYGGLSEAQLFDFLRNGKKLPRMKGLMGFYALLDDDVGLKRIDGWLVTSIARALHKRYAILGVAKRISAADLISGAWYDEAAHSDEEFDPKVRLPSLVRAWSAARKYYFAYGLDDVEPPKYISYY